MQTTTTIHWALQLTDDMFVIAKDPIRDNIVSIDHLNTSSLFDHYYDAEAVLEKIIAMKRNLRFSSWDPRIVQVACTLTACTTIHSCRYKAIYHKSGKKESLSMILPKCPNPTIAALTFKQIMSQQRGKYALDQLVALDD